MKNTLNQHEDLRNRIFGGYKVTASDPLIKIYRKIKKQWYWECLCLSCGALKRVLEPNLKQNINGCKDCSCRRLGKDLGRWVRDNIQVSLNPKIAAHFNNYRRIAKQKNRKFDISYAFFAEMVSKDCFYCGAIPRPIRASSYKNIVVNGIDRINNDLGYIESNCVPCCTRCNQEKRDLTKEKIYKFFPDLKPLTIGSEAMLYM
jgi:hypothetical protein